MLYYDRETGTYTLAQYSNIFRILLLHYTDRPQLINSEDMMQE